MTQTGRFRYFFKKAIINQFLAFKTDLVRKGDNFEQKYLEGRFGAIPYLNAFDRFFNSQNATA